MKKTRLSFLIMCFLVFSFTSAIGFSSHNTTISRSFDKEEAIVDELITITVSFVNQEAYVLRGFYYTEQVPDGLTVNTISVKIEGSTISNYVGESGSSGDVYPDFIPYRWVFETPINFAEKNPIPENAAVEIVYSVTSSQAGTFDFDEFSWVGYYESAPEGERAAFGYSADADKQTITFTEAPQLPVANFSATPRSGTAPLEVSFADLSVGGIDCWSWSFGDGGTSTEQDPICTYDAPGDYTVTLEITGSGGSDTETKNNYIRIAETTPAEVRILGSWMSGASHPKEEGSNRALLFLAHVKHWSADMELSSVSYGGQPMTMIGERNVGTGGRAYVVAYILDEAGIAAATGDIFTPTWTLPRYITPAYSSVFLENVDQAVLIGDIDSNGTTNSNTLATGALYTHPGDLVVVAGTCGNAGTYSVDNDFTEALELSIQWADGVVGYKPATGLAEIPGITHSNANRQVIIGFVVRAGGTSGPDLDPPSPDPMTWEILPHAAGLYSISMTATSATDPSGVEYYFECLTAGGNDSGWQASATYMDTGLEADTEYIYRVKARDKSPNGNETEWSQEAYAITGTAPAEVRILNSWVSGTSHPKEEGSNRALLFLAHVKHWSADMELSSVSYGGQPMTMIGERNVGTGGRAYVVAYILDEAGIAAATGDIFTPTWTLPRYITPAYSSVFLENVDQAALFGDYDSNDTTENNTLATGALFTHPGDLVVVAGTCGNAGTYSVDNDFTEALELSIQWADGVVGFKPAIGLAETPSITHSNANRQVIIGFVVRAAIW